MFLKMKGFSSVVLAAIICAASFTAGFAAAEDENVIFKNSFQNRSDFSYGGKNPTGYAVIKTDNKPEYAPYSNEPVHSLQLYKSDTAGTNYVSAECSIAESSVNVPDSGIIYEIKINAGPVGNSYLKLFGTTGDDGKMSYPVWIKGNKFQNNDSATAVSESTVPSGWFTLTAVVDKDGKFDLYAGGEKINGDTKWSFYTGTPVIKDFGVALTNMNTRYEGIRLDDLLIQKKASVYLQRALLKNETESQEIVSGQDNIDNEKNYNQIVLDFNTIINENTLDNMSVAINGVTEEACRFERDIIDPTRVNVLLDNPLKIDENITVNYDGVEDIFNTAANGKLDFAMKKRPTQISVTDELEWLNNKHEQRGLYGVSGGKFSFYYMSATNKAQYNYDASLLRLNKNPMGSIVYFNENGFSNFSVVTYDKDAQERSDFMIQGSSDGTDYTQLTAEQEKSDTDNGWFEGVYTVNPPENIKYIRIVLSRPEGVAEDTDIYPVILGKVSYTINTPAEFNVCGAEIVDPKTIKLTFNMPVSECSAADFKVNGQEVSGIELKQSNLTKHEVYLKCSSTLMAGDNTITAEGIANIMGNVMDTQQITVTAPEIYVSGIEQSSENKAVMTVCGYAAAQPVTAVAGAAEYDADGQLTAVQFVKDLSITETEQKITFDELPIQAGGYIKGFVWKNLNDLIPLTQSKKAEIK